MARMQLFTIGYEGTEITEFIQSLVHAGVDTVVDVRHLPLSRKRGFSKTALRTALEANGLRYIHYRSLGAPKQLRDALHSNGNWSQYVEGYRLVISTNGPIIAELASQVRKGEALALLCFEYDETACHRSLVAQAVKEHSPVISVRHLHAAWTKKASPRLRNTLVGHD